ncbi:MAG: tyrosine-type recombinase/integrase, partial [Lachnoanaerobaculum saburreum]
SVFKYFYRVEKINENIMERIQLPKLHSKEIIRLDIDEVAMMIDEAEKGEGLSDRQKAYHEKTKVRDVALLSLLLGTGIRVSECVGLDISDVDFKNNGILIHRKGGKEVTIYFSDEVREALQNYLDERVLILEESGHEGAFFLSMQNKRMSVRSVENLVKKYARIISPLKKITPHKLRSTYGTNLYKETGDIYLVADVLGHSDVNTTKKHYAAIEDDRRKSARNAVKLRES